MVQKSQVTDKGNPKKRKISNLRILDDKNNHKMAFEYLFFSYPVLKLLHNFFNSALVVSHSSD